MFNMKWLVIFSVIFAAPAFAAEQCETNFTKKGNFFKGSTFKTWANVEGVSTSDAYKKVYQYMAKDGWKLSPSDKELGIISASQEVSFGNGKSAPLNVVIEDDGGSTKISMNYSVSGGVTSPKKAVLKSFCETIASAKP